MLRLWSSMRNSNCLTKYPSKAIRIKVLTRTRASVKLVHIAISSRVDISGYRFRLNVCSNSCNCCDVKWVRWRRWRLFFLSFFVSSLATICSSCITKLVFSTFTLGSLSDRLPKQICQTLVHIFNWSNIRFTRMTLKWTHPNTYRRLYDLGLCCCANLSVVENVTGWYQDCLQHWSLNCGCYHENHLFRPTLQRKRTFNVNQIRCIWSDKSCSTFENWLKIDYFCSETK